MPPTPPLFKPKETVSGLGIDHRNDEWLIYVSENFDDDDYSATHQAFTYNLDNLTAPIDNQMYLCWLSVLNTSKQMISSANTGKILNTIYNSSIKSQTIKMQTGIALTRESMQGRRSFLLEELTSGEDFSYFFLKDMPSSINLVKDVTTARKNGPDETSRFRSLITNVFTPNTIQKLTNIPLIFEVLSTATELINELPTTAFFKHKSDELTFLLSTFYLAASHVDANSKACETLVMVLNRFETAYPDAYKQFRILEDLNSELTLDAVITQLNLNDVMYEYKLPELDI